MGAVYAARQLPLDWPVALKTIDAKSEDAPKERSRFEQEARAIASLRHPSVVELKDFGVLDDGTQFLVMELLRGVELSHVIASAAPMPERRVLHIVEQILEVLAEAHALGIIHRDLKPSNIFLEPIPGKTDFVKVFDFGIAKLGPGADTASATTQTGRPVGTPKYMSPEQCRATGVTPSTDLYSLGLIAFEMLTGSAPFERASAAAYYIAHAVETPAPLIVDGQPMTGPLAELVGKCLAKNPAERPSSAQAALDFLRTSPGSPHVPGPGGQGQVVGSGDVERATTAFANEVAPAGFITRPQAGLEDVPPAHRAVRRWATIALAGAALAVGVVATLRATASPEPSISSVATETRRESDAGVALAAVDPVTRSVGRADDGEPPAEVAVVPTTSPPSSTSRDVDASSASSPDVGGPVVHELDAVMDTSAPAKSYSVTVVVKPAAGSVKVGDQVLGPGNAVVTWREGEAAPRVLVQLAGHISKQVTLGPDDDGTTKSVSLVRAPRPSQREPTASPPPRYRPGESGIEMF